MKKTDRRLQRRWTTFGLMAAVLLLLVGAVILWPVAAAQVPEVIDMEGPIIDEVAMEGIREIAGLQGEPIEIAEPAAEEEADGTAISTTPARTRRNLNKLINLQGVVDQWVQDYRGYFRTASVEIYDMDFGTVVASYNADASMWPRSLYKLFYTYNAYARIDAGLDDASSLYLGSTTLGKCLDIIIRESNNPCAEAMLDDPVRAAGVAELVSQLGLANTKSDGLKTSAHDVSLLLQHYYKHPDWSVSSWQKFRDSALNQTWTYRKGLPEGFAEAAVYNKTGFGYGSGGMDVYNDAAMVEFTTASGGLRRYVMVVMTADPASYTPLTELGARLEKAISYE